MENPRAEDRGPPSGIRDGMAALVSNRVGLIALLAVLRCGPARPADPPPKPFSAAEIRASTRRSRRKCTPASPAQEGWLRSPPEDQARRSVYVHIKRSLILPIHTA